MKKRNNVTELPEDKNFSWYPHDTKTGDMWRYEKLGSLRYITGEDTFSSRYAICLDTGKVHPLSTMSEATIHLISGLQIERDYE